MTHLGTQISALADGRLVGAARERALCHVAACEPCAQELAATRAARWALAAADDVPPAPDLTPRLLALGAIGPCGAVPRPAPGTGAARPGAAQGVGRVPASALGGGPVLDAVFQPAMLDRSMTGGRRPSLRSVTVLTVGAVVVGLFLLGEARDVTPESHPAEDLALLAAAGSAGGGLAAAAPAGAGLAAGPAEVDASVLDAVWPGSELPDGYTVVATDADADLGRIDLDGPAGSVVVLRQPGHLRAEVVADVPTTTIGEHEVHVLSTQPWHAVWQSGDAVVVVVAAHRSTAVDDLVATYPTEHGDDGLSARVQRGWQVLVGAWSP